MQLNTRNSMKPLFSCFSSLTINQKKYTSILFMYFLSRKQKNYVRYFEGSWYYHLDLEPTSAHDFVDAQDFDSHIGDLEEISRKVFNTIFMYTCGIHQRWVLSKPFDLERGDMAALDSSQNKLLSEWCYINHKSHQHIVLSSHNHKHT